MNKSNIDAKIFWPSLLVIIGVTLALAMNTETAEPVLNNLLTSITYNFDWLFEYLTVGVFLWLIWLAFGKYGRIKLGGPEDKPEFSKISWIAMMFCAGMGTSIMFWSIMEPVYYMGGPPFGIEPFSNAANEWALAYGLFHWGFTAWAIYWIPGVAIAYSFYVRKQPSLKISTACKGILGKHADGLIGKIIDIMIIWGLVGGLGTSLGLGVPMVSEIVSEIFSIPQSFELSVAIVIIWTIIFGTSVFFGLKGIQKLSDINIYLAIGIAIFVFLVGPTLFLLSNFTNSFGLMMQNIVRMSFSTDPFVKGGFPQSWTVFYWAWFAATAPFMGLFVARISKGRTIREFITTGLVWGPIGGWVYFAVFGGYAIHLETNGIVSLTDIANTSGGPAAIVALFKTLPLSQLILPVFLVLAFIFLATSLDSATYILSAIATKELKDGEEPARWHRLLWAAVLAFMALSLLKIGGLNVIQTSSVLVAIPVVVIFFLLIGSVMKWLKEDFGYLDNKGPISRDDKMMK
ncbi:betaine/carnitine transporter, BCCT family [Desulfonispora thiosulfatigenes DSM 11270]|uniref:Betaine/carnitine transporter, BCCT family n=1 Tax=Desulfonispora thiosulfatigenes DSM 11270 TaxID=656914 RepID=A0A1W1URV6_DESTI|nr:BCCT family transporter [Desulfonispora thiosulfatigenes]SMB83551.1 betaine/carnitine transporter, BCCT family [Desulfonispora thiosulfatigenes DSM 11270]